MNLKRYYSNDQGNISLPSGVTNNNEAENPKIDLNVLNYARQTTISINVAYKFHTTSRGAHRVQKMNRLKHSYKVEYPIHKIIQLRLPGNLQIDTNKITTFKSVGVRNECLSYCNN